MLDHHQRFLKIPRFSLNFHQTLRPRIFRSERTKSCRIPFKMNELPSVAFLCVFRSTRATVRQFRSVSLIVQQPHIHVCALSVNSVRDSTRALCAYRIARSVYARIIDRNIIFIESTGHNGLIDREKDFQKETTRRPKVGVVSFQESFSRLQPLAYILSTPTRRTTVLQWDGALESLQGDYEQEILAEEFYAG